MVVKKSGGARPGAGRKKCQNCLPCKIISFKVSLEKETEAKEEIKLIIQKKYSHVEKIKVDIWTSRMAKRKLPEYE